MSRPDAIRAQVERILATQAFRSSHRLIHLLQYLSEHFIVDPESSISEYQLGYEVFERSSDFDPQVDSVVRVQITRLRQKLNKYYAEAGSGDEVLIEVRRGGYSLNVTFREVPKPVPVDLPRSTLTPQEGDPLAPESKRPHSWMLWGVGALAVLIALSVAFVHKAPLEKTPSIEPTVISFTSDPGIADNPSFSPDGTAVAFSGSSDRNREIFVKQIKSGQIRQLTHDKSIDVNPAWSPDGSSIAFYRVHENSGDFVVTSLGGGAMRIVGSSRSVIAGLSTSSTPMPPVGPAWTRDRNHLVVVDKDGAGRADCLFLLDIRDGSKALLTSPPVTTVGDGSPAVSPDGRTIAFVRTTSYGTSDLFLVPLQGGQPQPITSDHADINGLAWTGDGHQLIFSSNRAGSHRLWRLSIDTGQIEPFSATGLNALHPAVDPTRNRLVFAELTTNTNIWRVDLRLPLEKRKPVKWIASTRHQDSPQYSPDGKSIAFISDRSGYWELWLANSSGENVRRLTHFDGPSVGSPQWSPDGKEIAFDVRSRGVSNISIINVDTGTIRQVTHENADAMAPRWSVDGRWLYVVSRRADQLQIWRISLDGALWTQMTRNGGFDGTELAGRSQLLFARPRDPGFWDLDLRSGQEAQIPELADVKSYRYWAVSPAGIFYVSTSNPRSQINFYDFKTHRITKIIEMEGELFSGTPSLTVSPDGNYLVYAQVDSFSAELELAENW